MRPTFWALTSGQDPMIMYCVGRWSNVGVVWMTFHEKIAVLPTAIDSAPTEWESSPRPVSSNVGQVKKK